VVHGGWVLVAVVALAVPGAVARQQARIQEGWPRSRKPVAVRRSRRGVGRRSQPPYGRTSGTIGVETFGWVLRNEGPTIVYMVKSR
jgi:hypothetical protein